MNNVILSRSLVARLADALELAQAFFGVDFGNFIENGTKDDKRSVDMRALLVKRAKSGADRFVCDTLDMIGRQHADRRVIAEYGIAAQKLFEQRWAERKRKRDERLAREAELAAEREAALELIEA